jgi:hypothetical protein
VIITTVLDRLSSQAYQHQQLDESMWNLGLFLLAGLLASVVSEPIPLQARQTAAPILRRQTAPSDCTFFDTAYSEDDDCEYFANLWGITVADFIAWVRDIHASY